MQVQILFKDVGYTFPNDPRHMRLQGLNFSVPQGKLVVLVGPKGCGKATLLRLLSQNLLPQEGEVFVPPHLKTVNVAIKPLIFDASFSYNLMYGASPTRNIKDCKMLCEMLGMDEMYTKRLSDPAFKLGYNGNRLSLADRSLVCLIRGILADPDVLIVHRPIQNYGAKYGEHVYDLLKKFTKNRGLVPGANSTLKTVFVSTTPTDASAVEHADFVLHMHEGGQIDVCDQRMGLRKPKRQKPSAGSDRPRIVKV